MPYHLIRALDQTNGGLGMVIGILGTIGNSMTLTFFVRSKKDLIKVLYLLISVVDLLTCLMMFPIAMANLNFRTGMLFDSSIFCNLHGLLWNVCARMTVFLMMVLSITRTMFLLWPFKIINDKLVYIAVGSYFVIQFGQGCLPFLVRILVLSQNFI